MMKHLALVYLACLYATALFVLSDSALAQQPSPVRSLKQAGKGPLKVFILAGQSNMEGQAVADLEGKDYNDGGGYELAGFVWYHGWNDGCEPKTAVPEYEQNLVNLIKDVRKELNAPNLSVVVGELTGPWVQAPGEWATLRQAQAAARPEFQGNARFVETHGFVRQPEASPNPGHGHHEFGNAETYFLVGHALGQGMKQLFSYN